MPVAPPNCIPPVIPILEPIIIAPLAKRNPKAIRECSRDLDRFGLPGPTGRSGCSPSSGNGGGGGGGDAQMFLRISSSSPDEQGRWICYTYPYGEGGFSDGIEARVLIPCVGVTVQENDIVLGTFISTADDGYPLYAIPCRPVPPPEE